MMNGRLALSGAVSLRVTRRSPRPESFASIWRRVLGGLPIGTMSTEVRLWRLRNLPNLLRGLWTVVLSRIFRLPCFWGELYLRKIGADGKILNYGLASLRVVTDTGVAFIVDAFQGSTELENMKYHGFGTGTGNEAAGDSALGTELTTEYATDNVRPTGSTEEGATGNIFKTIATMTINSGTPAVTEHGVFSQAATGGGVLLDRSKFSAINLVSGDSIQSTYQLTLTSGS